MPGSFSHGLPDFLGGLSADVGLAFGPLAGLLGASSLPDETSSLASSFLRALRAAFRSRRISSTAWYNPCTSWFDRGR